MSLVLSDFDKAKRKRKSEDLIFFRVDLFYIYDFTIRISPLEINKLESPKMTHDELFMHKIWCPITQTYASYQARNAARIVPRRVGPIMTNILFGEVEENQPMSVRNGVLSHPTFEE
jgi:hypothetical protein